MGGIAGPGIISPTTWGLLLFAFEMYVLFRAFSLGRGMAALALDSDLSCSGPISTCPSSRDCWCWRRRPSAAGSTAVTRPRSVARPGKSELEAAGLVDEIDRPPRPDRHARQPRLLIAGGLRAVCLVNPFTYRALRERDLSLHPALPAHGENHDGRPALVLRALDSRKRRAGMVLAAGLLSHPGRTRAGLVLPECAPIFLEPFPAVRGNVGDLGHLHARQPVVRGRLRRGGRAQRSGVVPGPIRDRRPAGTAVDGLVDWRPAASLSP